DAVTVREVDGKDGALAHLTERQREPVPAAPERVFDPRPRLRLDEVLALHGDPHQERAVHDARVPRDPDERRRRAGAERLGLADVGDEGRAARDRLAAMTRRPELVDREHLHAAAVGHLEPVLAHVLHEGGVAVALAVVHEAARPQQGDVLPEVAGGLVRGYRDAPRHVDGDGTEIGRDGRPDEERADLEARMWLVRDEDLCLRARGDRDRGEGNREREPGATHKRAGWNARAPAY